MVLLLEIKVVNSFSSTNTCREGVGVEVAIQNNCLASAVILVLSGIDSMAFLNMPASQTDVTRTDFIKWADRYIKFPCHFAHCPMLLHLVVPFSDC